MTEVVAELGQTGGGDVGRYIDAVHAFAEAGADAVKVQMIDPARLAHPGAAPYWQTTRYADDQAESFRLAGIVPHDGWGPVRSACRDLGIRFIATPFDLAALDPLLALAPDAVKVASGDITFRPLLVEIARRFDRIILSTGASDDSEVMAALRWLKVARERPSMDGILPLACSLEYPCPDEHARLHRIGSLAELTRVRVGYSDHTVQTDLDEAWAAGKAVGAAGAVMTEKHVMLADDPDANVPDMDMALTPDLFAYYAGGFRAGVEAHGAPAPFGPYPDEQPARVGARRAVYVPDLPAGHVLTDADLTCLRPCPVGACPPAHIESLRGRSLAAPVTAGYITAWTWVGSDVRGSSGPPSVTLETAT